jgi:hypothetical protein
LNLSQQGIANTLAPGNNRSLAWILSKGFCDVVAKQLLGDHPENNLAKLF